MFKEVSPKLNLIQMEEAVLRMWKHRHIFEKSGAHRKGQPEYVFYEGPPTANGQARRAPCAGARLQGCVPAL